MSKRARLSWRSSLSFSEEVNEGCKCCSYSGKQLMRLGGRSKIEKPTKEGLKNCGAIQRCPAMVSPLPSAPPEMQLGTPRSSAGSGTGPFTTGVHGLLQAKSSLFLYEGGLHLFAFKTSLCRAGGRITDHPAAGGQENGELCNALQPRRKALGGRGEGGAVSQGALQPKGSYFFGPASLSQYYRDIPGSTRAPLC